MADFDLALLLVSLSVIYSLFVMGWEKARRHLLYERTPAIQPNVLATWCFAAAILLPPATAAAVTALSEASGWSAYNSAGTNRLYRFVYHMMTSVLSVTLACSAFRLRLSFAGALPLAAATFLVVGPGLTDHRDVRIR